MDQETERILDLFEQISRIPRKSKNELRIARWLQNRGIDRGLKVRCDEANNVVIYVPPTRGYERSATVVIQAHMDMVCEKTPESSHDFATDPIQVVRDGEWLRASDTTLGADNGIGLALALATAMDGDLAHPPLELLFTAEEETGLTGAKRLKQDFVSGRMLLNLDSEEEGVFTIGCAGGRDAVLSRPLERTDLQADAAFLTIQVGGLSGGHSGADIALHRANANKLLARTVDHLFRVRDGAFQERILGLAAISGGTVRNAIPREAAATLAVHPAIAAEITSEVGEFEAVLRAEYAGTEPNIQVRAEAGGVRPTAAYGPSDLAAAVGVLMVVPNGVQEMSAEIDGLVETSCNLAVIGVKADTLEINMSQRSSVMSRLDEVTRRIDRGASLAGMAVRTENSYPAWKPNTDSALLAGCVSTYRSVFSEAPKVEAIHAGLECAVIGATYDGMDMVSFGPTIRRPHSPQERAHIPSIGKTWRFLKGLLAALK